MCRGIDLAAHLDLRDPVDFCSRLLFAPVSYIHPLLFYFSFFLFSFAVPVWKIYVSIIFTIFIVAEIRWMSQIWIRWDPFIPTVRFRINPLSLSFLSLSRSLPLCFRYVFYDRGYYRWILIVSWVWRLICGWIYRLSFFFLFGGWEIYKSGCINRFNFPLRKKVEMFRREYNSGLHNLHHDCAMMNELNWQALLFFYFFIVIKEREREL